ncbi:MAG: hypothetical protein V2G40_05375 [bacterium JZ-2024 1]
MRRTLTLLYLSAILLTLPLLFFPLLNNLSYEFALITSCFLYFLSASLGYSFLSWCEMKYQSASDTFLSAFFLGLLSLIPLICLPLCIILMRGLKHSICDLSLGLVTYFFLTIPASLIGFALGILIGSYIEAEKGIFLFYTIGFFLFSSVLSFLEFWFGPRFSLHHLILGPLQFFLVQPELAFSQEIGHQVYILLVGVFFLFWGYLMLARRKSPKMVPVAGVALFLSLPGLIVPYFLPGDPFRVTFGKGAVRYYLSASLVERPVTLHYSPGKWAEKDVEKFFWMSVFAVQKVSRELEVKPEKVDIYLLTPEQKKVLTGGTYVHFTKPWRKEVYISQPDDWILLQHELVHILAGEFGPFPFRVPLNGGLTEGLAEAISRGYHRRDEPHYPIAGALQKGLSLSAEKVCSPTGFFTRAPVQSYAIAGSFIGFLLRTYKLDQFKEVYSGKSFEDAFNSTLWKLDTEWKEFLSRLTVPQEFLQEAEITFSTKYLPPFYLQLCPREREKIQQQALSASQFLEIEHAIERIKRLYNREPANPFWIRLLAQLHRKKKDWDGAKEWLLKLTSSDFPAPVQISAYEELESLCAEKKDEHCVQDSLKKILSLSKFPLKNFRKEVQLQLVSQDRWNDYFALHNPCSSQARIWIVQNYRKANYPLLLTLLSCNTPLEENLLRDLDAFVQKNPEWRELYAQLLKSLGYSLVSANRFTEGNSYLQRAMRYLPPAERMEIEDYLKMLSFVQKKIPPEGF